MPECSSAPRGVLSSLALTVCFYLLVCGCSPYGLLCHREPGSSCDGHVEDAGAPQPVCGDGLLERGEACDDGANGDPDDGCRDDCHFSCESALDCLDGERCNGAELCDRETHRCLQAQPFPDGAACRRYDESRGVCRAGECVGAGCGNGVLERAEECDDGNAVPGDGCNSHCVFTCHADVDCDDGNMCNGLERCDDATHRCVPGEALECEDGDPCTVDFCAPNEGCASRFIDSDGDGFAPSSLGRCMGDPLRGGDCQDEDSRVYPGQTEWFMVPYASRAEAWSWDYDCDGRAMQREQRVSLGACGLDGACDGGGWVGHAPIRCGGSGPFVHCRGLSAAEGGECASVVSERVQSCR